MTIAGSAWYWNNFSCGEHTGTHFDAPIHWVSGRDLPNNATDSLPVQQLIGAACVIDCSAPGECGTPDFLLTADYLEDWEAVHGRIPPRVLGADAHGLVENGPILFAYQNYDETGQHTPGPAVDAVRFLVDDRDVAGFGFRNDRHRCRAGLSPEGPPIPAITNMHGAGRYGLQCLTNLDLLPPTGRRDFLRAAQDQETGRAGPIRGVGARARLRHGGRGGV